jgi:outer membrane protein TolC
VSNQKSPVKSAPRVRWALYAAAAMLAGALFACESPFADQADRATYRLIEQRQRQSLGYTSDSLLEGDRPPIAITPEAYAKVPPTDNNLASATRPGDGGDASTQAATGPATNAASSMNKLLDAVGDTVPDLDKLPELPEFPRAVAKGKVRLVFNLDDCFNYSLAKSRDYRTQKEDLYIAALNVTLARHTFEPSPFAVTSAGVSGVGEASDYNAALSASQTVGVTQNLPYGGQIVATALAQTVNQLQTSVAQSTSADLILAANIPLLRGAGMVAQENLIQTERTLIYQVRNFEHYRRAFLVSVASNYFNLINQRTQVLNRYRSVRSYTFITDRTQALFEAGQRKVSLLDVQRAKQSEYQARNDLINSIAQYELSVDGFKLLLGMPTEQPMDVKPQYLDIAPPRISDPAAVAIADKLRLDLQTARDQVEDARRGTKVAANNLLPDLNVDAKVDTGSNRAVRTVGVDARNGNYAANLTLVWPLDRVAERNAYRVSMINLDQAKRNVEQTQDQVALDVRAATRQVREQIYLVALQKKNIELAQNRKEFADIQFKNGKIDNRDYLDAESALLDAQNRFAQAVSGLQIAVLQYLRDTDQLRVDYQGRFIPPAASDQRPGAGPAGAAAVTRPATAPATPR